MARQVGASSSWSYYVNLVAMAAVFCIFLSSGVKAQGPFDNGLDFIQCYACADCEWIDPDTTPRCRRPSQNPLVPHSIGYSFPDSLSTRSCIKVIDRDGRVYRGCHNRVARDCVIVENVTACYCEDSLCNGAPRLIGAGLPWLSTLPWLTGAIFASCYLVQGGSRSQITS